MKTFEFSLSEVLVNHQQFEQYKKNKPRHSKLLEDWIVDLQASVQTQKFECKYYFEVTISYTGLLSRNMPVLTVPITIYHQKPAILGKTLSDEGENFLDSSSPPNKLIEVP